MSEPTAGRRAGRTARTALIAHPGAELYGSDRVMLETATGLVDRGWRVVVALPSTGPLVGELHAAGAETVIMGVPVLRKAMLKPRNMPGFLAGTMTGGRRIDALLKRLQPDVVYVSTLTVPLWVLRARLRRIPVLCHVHESERGASMVLREAIAWPLLLATRVVANSRFSLDSLTEVVPSLAKRATVVYNGVRGPEAVQLPRAELVPDGLRVVYVGRVAPRKGVDLAVAAVGMLREAGVSASLDIVGSVFPGYEWYEEELRTQVAELGLRNQVRFLGFRSSVWSALADADVAVVPSRLEEPFGNTAVEALLAARPVVVAQIGGLAEAIDGFASAIPVEPDDAHDLAQALMRVAAGWSVYRRSAVALAQVAAKRYAPETYRADICHEINQVAGIDDVTRPLPVAS